MILSTPSASNTPPGPSAAQLFAAAFAVARDPRSAEYRAGVQAALEFRVDGKRITRPYPPGSAADDAYDAGLVEGHWIWRRACFKEGAAS